MMSPADQVDPPDHRTPYEHDAQGGNPADIVVKCNGEYSGELESVGVDTYV